MRIIFRYHVFSKARTTIFLSVIRIYFILGKDYNGESPAPPGSFIPRKDKYGVPIAEPQVGLQGNFS